MDVRSNLIQQFGAENENEEDEDWAEPVNYREMNLA